MLQSSMPPVSQHRSSEGKFCLHCIFGSLVPQLCMSQRSVQTLKLEECMTLWNEHECMCRTWSSCMHMQDCHQNVRTEYETKSTDDRNYMWVRLSSRHIVHWSRSQRSVHRVSIISLKFNDDLVAD